MSMSSIFRKKSKAPLVADSRSPPPATVVVSGSSDELTPDTRVLSTLGGCASAVSTVVEDTLLPLSPTLLPLSPTLLDFPRRQSSASCVSAASTILYTPTYPSEPEWEQRRPSESSKPTFEVVKDTEPEVSKSLDDSKIRVEAPTPERALSDDAHSSAWSTSYSSDLFASRSDEYDMSKLLAALGEDIKADEQAVVSPFGFETIGRGKEAKFFKDRGDVDTEDFYVPTFTTKHTTTTSFRQHTPGSRFGGLQEHLRNTGSRSRAPPSPARPMRAIPEPR